MSKQEYDYNGELWQEIVDKGKEQDPESRGIINRLQSQDIETILATMEYWNTTDVCMKQTKHDLTIPRFRVFDWLAMNIMGRNDDDRRTNNTSLKVLVYAFRQAKYNPSEFVRLLRERDYEIDKGWEKIEIDAA